jgi:hypothetical protein
MTSPWGNQTRSINAVDRGRRDKNLQELAPTMDSTVVGSFQTEIRSEIPAGRA